MKLQRLVLQCRDNDISSSYPSRNLLGKRVHQAADAVLCHHCGVEDKLLVAVILPVNLEAVRHQWVPVVQRVELGCNAVLVLEVLVEEQLGIELKFEVVPAQVLHVVLNHNLDGLTCGTNELFNLMQTNNMWGSKQDK